MIGKVAVFLVVVAISYGCGSKAPDTPAAVSTGSDPTSIKVKPTGVQMDSDQQAQINEEQTRR